MAEPSPKRRKTTQGSSMLSKWLTKPSCTLTQDLVAEEMNINRDPGMEIEILENPTTQTKQTPVKVRISGVDPTWKRSFPWLIITQDKSGMLCTYCTKHGKKAKNGTDTWIGTPCTTLVKESLNRHQKSKTHQEAAQLEAQSILAGKGQGIQDSLTQHCTLERTALIGAFRCLYWLANEEIPHTTHFKSLLELAKTLGCDYLDLLHKGDNVNYTSQRTMQDMLQTITQQIQLPIMQDLNSSTYYSILIDETTDISIVKQMTLMARYFTPNMELKTTFLELIDLPDGKADTIMTSLKNFFTTHQLDTSRLIGFGSDGASVMVGRKTGVATQLKAINPEMLNVHCIAHRLALASGQASSNIPYLKKFKDIMRQLFYFYQNSAVRMHGLKEIENILGDPVVKLKDICDTRWLSHLNSVEAVKRCHPALIASLEREASERTDATAAGLAMFVKSPFFLCAIAMLLDTLPHLNRLSKLFQKTSIDFSMVDTLVSSTQLVLTNLLDNPGPNTKDIATYFNSLEEYGVKYKQTEVDRFQEQVYQPFINNVISNLHDRFPDTSVLDSFSVFDPDLLDQRDPSTNEYLQFQKLKKLAKQFPSIGTSDAAEEEFTSLRNIITSKMKDQTSRQVLEKTAKMTDLYPILSKYCQIALVVPVSTADCERTFSTLNRVKSILRNRLSQHILNCLMTISTEGPSIQNFDFQACVTAFAQKKKRKLNL